MFPPSALDVARQSFVILLPEILLLLTATPRHHGLDTQFGLLHLVDPERFPDFATFQKQNKRMAETAGLATQIQEENRSPELAERLLTAFPDDKDLGATVERYTAGGPAAAARRRSPLTRPAFTAA